jgi:hypothetical protein
LFRRTGVPQWSRPLPR